VDPADWSLHPLAGEPLARPIDVRIHPVTGDLYVLDFGQFEMHATRGVVAEAQSGRLWRVAAPKWTDEHPRIEKTNRRTRDE
jgi:hypothetical protein